MKPTPLIDIAEGRDQDDRGDLFFAFKRCSQWRKITQTNLHVRELLMYVMATDRDGRGVQKSYSEIANRLELKDDQAARYVIARAKEWGLLLVTEARYERGGQSANRYSINWPRVRAIRDGLDSGNPWQDTQRAGVTESQAGVTESQAGVTESHPYKECSRTVPRNNTFTSRNYSPPCLRGHAAMVDGLEEEEKSSALKISQVEGEMLGSPDPTPPQSLDSVRLDRLIENYTRAGVWTAREMLGSLATAVGCEYLAALLAYYDEHPALGPGALCARLRRSQPNLPIDQGWPRERRVPASAEPTKFEAGDPFA